LSERSIESFLVRLYVDAPFRHAFLGDRRAVAQRFGLSEEEITGAEAIDEESLNLAASSFEAKRKRRHAPSGVLRRFFFASAKR
jgi:hypothetical protein